MRRVLAFFGWTLIWMACAFAAAWGLVAMPLSAAFGSGRRARRLAVGFDQTGNVAGGGDEDEPFSARCWRLRRDPHYARWQRRIDRLFLLLKAEQDHCKSAFEHEQARRHRPYIEAPAPKF